MSDVPAPRYPTPNWDNFGNTIGNLFNTYQGAQQQEQTIEQNKMKLQQQKLQADLAQTFANGVPTDANGNPDYAKAMQMLAAKGDPNAVAQFGPLIQNQQQINAPVSPLFGGAQVPASGAGANGGAAGAGGGGRFQDALANVESNNRNIPSTVDPDVAGPGTKSQGFFQINVPTWRDFAPSAGIDLKQYPTPMSAPREVQEQVANTIPLARFGPRTRTALEKKYGFGEDQKGLTIAELSSRVGGGGKPMAYAGNDTGLRTDASPAIPPVSAAAGSRIPRADAGPSQNQPGAQQQGQPPAAFGSPVGVRAAGWGAPQAPQANQGQPQQQPAQGPSLAAAIGNAAPPAVVANIARAVGVDPNSPMTPEQAQKAQAIVQNYAKRTGQQIGQPQAQGGGQMRMAQQGQPQGQGQPQAQQQPIMPQVPLPHGYTDPQQAILAIDQEVARLSSNPHAKGQIAALTDWRDRIAQSTAPMKVGPNDTFVDPRTGQPIYQGAYAKGAGEIGPALEGDAARYLETGTLPPNMGRGMQGAAQATAIRQRAAQMAAENGIDPSTLPEKWAQFKAQKGFMGQVADIAEGIKSGKQPPVLTGLYGLSGPVRQQLQKDGVDLSKMQIEWDRAKKQVASLNGPQFTRFVGLATSVVNTIDEVDRLSKEMSLSGVPLLNKIELQSYIQTQGNTPGGQLATQYLGAVNTLKEEFANLAQGGYAPTESAWKLANTQINENYGVKQLSAGLHEVRRLINYRVNAMPGMAAYGPGTADRYLPNNGPAKEPASERAPAKANSGLPEGWTVKVIQ